MPELVERARRLAEQLMADELPRRWKHVQNMAAKASVLAPALDGGSDLLVAAAWLHDIGYSSRVAGTGFHPLDGARYLWARGEAFELCCLVANHSAAAAEAQLRALSGEITEFPDTCTSVRDAVWACDMTTGPSGESIAFVDRLAEIRRRYPESHTVPVAIGSAADEIGASIRRTKERALAAGICVDLRV